MKKLISYPEYNKIRKEAQEGFEAKYINLYINERHDYTFEMVVNWSAIGSVEVSKAAEFAANLNQAVAYAAAFNEKYAGYTIDWSL